MKPKPLPVCVFCGGETVMVNDGCLDVWWLRCAAQHCRATVPLAVTRREAIAAYKVKK